MDIRDTVKDLTVRLRRGIEPDGALQEFRQLVNDRTDELCAALDTRWLVSVCDTIADVGTPIEQRNAMFVSMLANFEKVGQSYVFWRLNYEGSLDVPVDHQHRKLRLWDGMTSFHLDIGDVTNNMFFRLERLLHETPAIERIYRTVRDRMKVSETILAKLNDRHEHVFDTTYRWIHETRYDAYRERGEIPAWKGKD